MSLLNCGEILSVLPLFRCFSSLVKRGSGMIRSLIEGRMVRSLIEDRLILFRVELTQGLRDSRSFFGIGLNRKSSLDICGKGLEIRRKLLHHFLALLFGSFQSFFDFLASVVFSVGCCWLLFLWLIHQRILNPLDVKFSKELAGISLFIRFVRSLRRLLLSVVKFLEKISSPARPDAFLARVIVVALAGVFRNCWLQRFLLGLPSFFSCQGVFPLGDFLQQVGNAMLVP
mmetsp:Transcript_11937/g.24632  ORF Transcript_11937/g.24632 Transcript_11937/m.24632 type:complete len:229 (+) Transcript_11937:351-1037(+)